MKKENYKILAELYEHYNEIFKPLLAEVETRYESQPIVIFNEIRSFNDHIARCFLEGRDDKYIAEELRKARGHIKRAIYDCFKFLNVSYHKAILRFEKEIKNIDMTLIGEDAKFYRKYKKLKYKVITTIKEAKINEARASETAFDKYQETYNLYVKLDNLIEKNIMYIKRLKTKFTLSRLYKFFFWLLSAVIAGIISNTQIIKLYKKLFSTFK